MYLAVPPGMPPYLLASTPRSGFRCVEVKNVRDRGRTRRRRDAGKLPGTVRVDGSQRADVVCENLRQVWMAFSAEVHQAETSVRRYDTEFWQFA